MFDLEGKKNDTQVDSVLTRTKQNRECVEDPSKLAPEGYSGKEPDIFIDGKHHKFLNICKECAPLVCTSNSTIMGVGLNLELPHPVSNCKS
jgi:hypothetical protein